MPDALAGLAGLIGHGAQVELCGSCLHVRGLERDRLLDGTIPSSLKGLFTAVSEADAFVSLGG